MKRVFLFLSFFSVFFIFGQVQENYLLIDKKMASIPSEKAQTTAEIARFIAANFKTETDKIRATFYWTAANIRYDIANISTIRPQETPQDRITRTMQTHKGVCADYSLVFNEIAHLLGIKSFVVRGYTKQRDKVDSLSHAWCACRIDNKWYLFDATWGAGYVMKNTYVPKINNQYFKANPAQLIKSHMPFDYLWQLLNFPITHQEFIEGKTQMDKTKKQYNFTDEIAKYESLSAMNQFFESAQRIEKNGIKNQLILEEHTYKKESWAIERDNEMGTKYNLIVVDFNEAINGLNDFISYRNNRFQPNLSDEEISAKIQIPNEKLKKCRDAIYKINADKISNGNSLKTSIEAALAESETHLQFVNKYLSKGGLARKSMFYKVTLFGIPSN